LSSTHQSTQPQRPKVISRVQAKIGQNRTITKLNHFNIMEDGYDL
jgi:hypothetical protein